MLFIVCITVMWRGLSLHPSDVPSPLIGKRAPRLQLPLLLNTHLISLNKELKGHVTLLNVWASWCVACSEEHDLLLHIAKNKNFELWGLDYKDNPEAAVSWLERKGNPYQKVLLDKQGLTAIDWGVYGTPETFVIDKQGIIRYKQVGPILADDWQNIFLPLIQQLASAS